MLYDFYPIIISSFILLIVIVSSIQNRKLMRSSLVISFINLGLSIMTFFFYRDIKKDNLLSNIYLGYTIFLFILLLMIVMIIFKNASLKANHYQLFVKYFKNSRLNTYYIVDKKERIKDISDSLLEELDISREDVIGKKLFSVFNKSIRFTKRNSIDTNNRVLETYYLNYKSQSKPDSSEEEELIFLNANGETVILHAIMQPVYVLGSYKGRIVIGEKKTNFDMLSVERELNNTNSELESVRHKFIATLEISEEGLFYIDLDARIIWCSDKLVEFLSLSSNSMDLEDFRKKIDPTDLQKYLALIGDLTQIKNTYTISYRILINGAYMWFKEKGKRVFEDKTSSTIMGTLNPVATKHHRKSNIEELDDLDDENNLLVSMNKLLANKKYFQLLIFKLKNIHKINSDNGREVGNMAMATYINKIKNTFMTENSKMYRIDDYDFSVIITDPRKCDMLKSGFSGNKKFLNMTMNYGSITIDLEVFYGISISNIDANEEHKLLEQSKMALKMAENPDYNNHGCYYSNIK